MNDAALEALRSALPTYEIDGSELGRGGWGIIWAGRHTQLGREVAIKQLPGTFASEPDVRTRFVHEARMAASLEHPHIVQVYDFVNSDDGMALIVMERCSGSLAERLADPGVPTDHACAYSIATLSALDYAHRRGVLHRDIKPANLMFDAAGQVKLGDFGIARALGAASRLTAPGAVLGTPAFISPEQATGTELTPASDIYSVGIMLYMMLSGRHPYEGRESIAGLIHAHISEQPTPLTSAQVPPAIAEVVHQALSKSPTDRFASARDFGIALGEGAAHAFGPGWLRRSGVQVHGEAELVAATETSTPPGAPFVTPILIRLGAPSAPASTSGGPAADASPGGRSGIQDSPSWQPPPVPTPAGAAQVSSPPTVTSAGPPPPVADVATQRGATLVGTGAPGGIPVAAKILVPLLALVGLGALLFLILGGDGAGDGEITIGGDGTAQVDNDGGDDGGGQPDADDGGETAGPEIPLPPPDTPGDNTFNYGLVFDSDEPEEYELVARAVTDINSAGGVLGSDAVLLPPRTGAFDAGALVDLGATVIVGPGQPFEIDDSMEQIAGRVPLLNYNDFFHSDFTAADGYFRLRGTRGALLSSVVDEIEAAQTAGRSGEIVIAGGQFLAGEQAELPNVLLGHLRDAGYDARVVVEGEVVDDDETATGQALAQDIVETNPSIVVWMSVRSGGALMTAMRESGVTPQNTTMIVVGAGTFIRDQPDGAREGLTSVDDNLFVGEAFVEGELGFGDVFPETGARLYDAVIIAALAAEDAGSVDPDAVSGRIIEVTRGGTPCSDYATCVALVRDGVDIDYEGISGPVNMLDDGQPGSMSVLREVAGSSSSDTIQQEIVVDVDASLAQGRAEPVDN